MPIEFKPFPKMARLSRECIVTEKLDGTNAQIYILAREEVPQELLDVPTAPFMSVESESRSWIMLAGSRSRWLGAGKQDNYGFAAWVSQNREELIKLGPGQHFGEWWGAGIQRRYGLAEKRFSLFNASRWHADNLNGGVFELTVDAATQATSSRPGPRCCSVVPTLFFGEFNSYACCMALGELEKSGSRAAPGFMNPEGIVIYHTAAKTCFKKTIKDDASPKSLI